MMEECETDQTEKRLKLRTALLLGGTGEVGKQVVIICICVFICIFICIANSVSRILALSSHSVRPLSVIKRDIPPYLHYMTF